MGVLAPDAARFRALDRRLAWRVALAALGVRVLSHLVGFVTLLAVLVPQPNTVFPGPSPFWDVFTHFDSGWYEQIARHGYQYVVDSRVNIAYFPVYPMLMRYVGRLFGTYHAA